MHGQGITPCPFIKGTLVSAYESVKDERRELSSFFICLKEGENMEASLGKEQILQCFDALNEKLAMHNQYGEILVCGGASMALLFDNTTVTKDIDAVILSTEMKSEISRYAAEIGAKQGLDEGWFNEAAKGYVNLTWDRKEISRYSNLAVYSVPAEQLLAMKLSAARVDARDREDSMKLMKYLTLQNVDEALEILERNMPGRTLTAKNEYFTRETFAEYQEKEKSMEKKRLFIDMDGTLAVFTPVDTLETLYEKGYFASLPPHENVVEGIRQFLAQKDEDTEVYVMSSVLSDSAYALDEKQGWLDLHLPEIEAHWLFPPCGVDKSRYVPGGIKETDYLLDDYSKNLHSWQAAGGTGIKLMNGINGTKGSWKGSRIAYNLPPAQFCEQLTETMNCRLLAIGAALESGMTAKDITTGSTFENAGSSYVVLARKDAELTEKTDLLLMRSDGYIVCAKDFDTETKSWAYGNYYGTGLAALSSALYEFQDEGKAYFANLTYKEQFQAVLEAEFPKITGKAALQDKLYRDFMEDDHEEGFFSREFRKEIRETLSKEAELETERGWEME